MARWLPTNSITITDILSNVKNKLYDFDPEYQRSFHAWDDEKRNDLLNSIIDGYPVPALYVIEKNKKLVVIDGKQRITAIEKIFSENSEMRLGDQIKVKSLKSFFDFYTDPNDDKVVLVYNNKKYCYKDDNTIEIIDKYGSEKKLSRMNMNLFLDLVQKFNGSSNLTSIASNDINLYTSLIKAEKIRQQIKSYLFYCSKGEECTEDDETTLFGYLNAGESLSNSEELNGRYWNYALWRQAKHFNNTIKNNQPDMWEALFGKFRDKDRYQDIEFWADIFLTLYHKKASSGRVIVRRWKDIRPENYLTNGINKTDKLEDEEYDFCISILCKFKEFVTWEGSSDLKLKDEKKTPKVLFALYMTLYMEKEKRPDENNYLTLGMERADNLYKVINHGIEQMSYQKLLNSLLHSAKLN